MATADPCNISLDLPGDIKDWSVDHVQKFLMENETEYELKDKHIEVIKKEGFHGRDLLLTNADDLVLCLKHCGIPLGSVSRILRLVTKFKVNKGLAEPRDDCGTKRMRDGEEEMAFQPLRTNSHLIKPYRDIFLKVAKFRQYTKSDLDNNNISELLEATPPFVMSYLSLLERKRHLVENKENEKECQHVKAKLGDLFEEYFASEPAPEDAAKLLLVSSCELHHLVSNIAFDESIIRHNKRRKFKEFDANWTFFYAIGSHIKLSPPYFDFKYGETFWPFKIAVSNGTDNATYYPRSDFIATLQKFPLLIVEVSSSSQEQDCYRMLLQGAFIVRFANRFLPNFKKEKNFVLVAVYITEEGQVNRYLMFQNGKDASVFYVQDSFEIFGDKKEELFRFTLEMYNLVHSYKASEFADAPSLISELMNAIRAQQWPSVSKLVDESNKRHKANSGTRDHNQGGGGGRGGGEAQVFEANGYELVHGALEAVDGFQLWYQMPPHIHTIRRARDSSGAEFIAKKTRDNSNEAKVLEFLRMVESPSEHIIPLIESIESSLGKFVVLPKRSSVEAQLRSDSRGGELQGKFLQLSHDLARGLSFLHEHGIAHLDIKPDNMVYTNAFRLQIIDFDAAVRVKGEDEKINEYLGTLGWMAPEIGTESGARCMYSPIRADKWSCGRVFFAFAEKSSREGKELTGFAERLMNKNPLHRPSLLEWSEPLSAPPSDVGNGSKFLPNT